MLNDLPKLPSKVEAGEKALPMWCRVAWWLLLPWECGLRQAGWNAHNLLCPPPPTLPGFLLAQLPGTECIQATLSTFSYWMGIFLERLVLTWLWEEPRGWRRDGQSH